MPRSRAEWGKATPGAHTAASPGSCAGARRAQHTGSSRSAPLSTEGSKNDEPGRGTAMPPNCCAGERGQAGKDERVSSKQLPSGGDGAAKAAAPSSSLSPIPACAEGPSLARARAQGSTAPCGSESPLLPPHLPRLLRPGPRGTIAARSWTRCQHSAAIGAGRPLPRWQTAVLGPLTRPPALLTSSLKSLAWSSQPVRV